MSKDETMGGAGSEAPSTGSEAPATGADTEPSTAVPAEEAMPIDDSAKAAH